MPSKASQLPLSRRRAISGSLGVPDAAFRLIEHLFAPVDALGSEPDRVVRLLRAGGIGKRSRVLDLGCGKGATLIRVCRELECAGVGVDAYPAFVAEARLRARELGIAERCRVRVGLAQETKGTFDGVVCLNLFSFERALPVVRARTRARGVYLIDDAVLVGRGTGAPRAADVRASIESLGDRVLREHIWTAAQVRRRETRNYRVLEAGVRALGSLPASDRKLLGECLRRKRRAIRLLQGPLRPACWLVQRGR